MCRLARSANLRSTFLGGNFVCEASTVTEVDDFAFALFSRFRYESTLAYSADQPLSHGVRERYAGPIRALGS
jgi:hypothetical protein